VSKRIKREGSVTIGLDLGDRFSQVCVLDAEGEVEARFRVATTAKGLEAGLRRYPGARVVLGVGTHSPWVSHWLEGAGYEAIVANPRRLRSITHSDRKDDRADAEQLARLGRADPKLLCPIRHRGLEAQRDRALLQVRDGLVRARALLVNQARGLAKPLGLRLPKCTTEGFASRMRREGLGEAFPGMAALGETVEQLSRKIQGLEREIEAVSQERYPETALVRQVSGVGPVTGLAGSVGRGALTGAPAERREREIDPPWRPPRQGDCGLRSDPFASASSHEIAGELETAPLRGGRQHAPGQ
jgi:transposase